MAELGALSLRIETTGGEQALRTIRGVDDSAKRVTLTEKALSKEIAEGTKLWALQARTADVTNASMVAGLRKAATEQLKWMQAVGASDQQLLRHAATVQAFQRRVDSATQAQAAQARQFAIFGQAVTTTGGRLSAFSTRSITGLNAASFALSSFASGGAVNFRTLSQAAAGFAAFFGPGGAIASIGITAGLAMTEFFTRTRREIEETRKKATEELGKLDAAVETARRSRDPASLQAKLADDTEELAEKRIRLAAIEHRTAEARTEQEKALLPVLRERVKVLEQEIEIGRRAIFSPREARGTGTLQTVTVETRDAAAAERERQERIGKTIEALSALQKLNRQTGQDLVELARVHRELNAELLRGNVTLTRRAEIETLLAKVSAASLQAPGLRTPLGGGAVGPVRQFDAEAIQRGIAQAPRTALAARSTGLDEATAARLGSTFAGAFSGGFAEGLARGGVDDAVRGFLSQVLGGVGDIFNDLLAQQITDGILSATASASIAGVAATTAATSASAATAGAAATLAEVSAQRATAAATTAAAAAASASTASAGGGVGGAGVTAAAASTGNPWLLVAAVALPLLSSLLGGSRRASAPSQASFRSPEVPLSIRRLIVDPNAELRHRVASSSGRSTSAAVAPNPMEGVTFIVASDPSGQRYFAEKVIKPYQRRGG